MNFHQKRRQQFLTEAAYTATTNFFNEVAAPGYLLSLGRADFNAEDRARVADAYADETFTNYILRYTAGASIDELRAQLDQVVAGYEQSAVHIRAYQKNPDFPPLRFIEIDEYERVLQIIGLCFLLHRRELLPRVAALFDPASANKDTLYEGMLAFELSGRFELDRWYHDKPYRELINVMYRDENEESLADLERYLKNWYKSLAKAPWHDSHLNLDDEGCAGYFGYWAIEAAALVYLMDFDDQAFRIHLVYPKDLVAFAREFDRARVDAQPSHDDRMRVEGGQPCPKSGYWTTPAQPESRQFFKAGEVMPTFEHSAYGATIWQWSNEQ